MPARSSQAWPGRLLVAIATLSSVGPAQAGFCDNLVGEQLLEAPNEALFMMLRGQLGLNRFETLGELWAEGAPFQAADDGLVYASGCQAGMCGTDDAFVGVNIDTCDVFVTLRQRGKIVGAWPAEPDQWPAALAQPRLDWAAR